ncbi:MAG: uracil-DNA glycosylase [Actinomycetota bacterium]|nr:uracil-DNA glycosylase [Actinomycetota bacterium]
MTAREFVPAAADLSALARAAAGCRGCDLWENATQTVFGEGPPDARVVLVGEQPGDKEDVAGEPFVGPAGQLLDRALVDAGIERSAVYVTNVVKHFKWTPRGKRRIHQKPNAGEIKACWPWLEAEVDAIAPDIVVCLGASAAQAVLGRQFKVTQRRGEILESSHGWRVTATVHPSAILRADDREQQYDAFVRDLRAVAALLADQAA